MRNTVARARLVSTAERSARQNTLTLRQLQPRDDNSTLVEFTVEPIDSAVRVRVVESGISGLRATEAVRKEHAANGAQAWTDGLRLLQGIAEGVT